MRFRKNIFVAAFAATLLWNSTAGANVLLSLTNPGQQLNSPYSFTFLATSPYTEVAVGGYQLPAEEQVTNNSVTGPAGTNLLTSFWAFTPAALYSRGNTFDDGT